jgi:hypothetical protein
MSVAVQYKNGFKGFVSAAVAKILEVKKEAVIIGQSAAEAVDRAKLVAEAVKLKIAAKPNDLDGVSDTDLVAKIAEAKAAK